MKCKTELVKRKVLETYKQLQPLIQKKKNIQHVLHYKYSSRQQIRTFTEVAFFRLYFCSKNELIIL